VLGVSIMVEVVQVFADEQELVRASAFLRQSLQRRAVGNREKHEAAVAMFRASTHVHFHRRGFAAAAAVFVVVVEGSAARGDRV